VRRLGSSRTKVLDVAQRLVEQNGHMGVIESVPHLTAHPFTDDEVEVSQDPQLLRDSRLRQLRRLT
jgi:hypothetical protein